MKTINLSDKDSEELHSLLTSWTEMMSDDKEDEMENQKAFAVINKIAEQLGKEPIYKKRD